MYNCCIGMDVLCSTVENGVFSVEVEVGKVERERGKGRGSGSGWCGRASKELLVLTKLKLAARRVLGWLG